MKGDEKDAVGGKGMPAPIPDVGLLQKEALHSCGRKVDGREDLIGRGGYSTVWRCKQVETGRVEAIKVEEKRLFAASSHKSKGVRWEQECHAEIEKRWKAEYGSSLPLPFSPFHFVAETEHFVIAGMDMLDFSLDEAGIYLDESTAEAVGIFVVASLSALARLGITHADVKPANIMLKLSDGSKEGEGSAEGRERSSGGKGDETYASEVKPVWIDFGLTRIESVKEEDSQNEKGRKKREGAKGSPHYCSCSTHLQYLFEYERKYGHHYRSEKGKGRLQSLLSHPSLSHSLPVYSSFCCMLANGGGVESMRQQVLAEQECAHQRILPPSLVPSPLPAPSSTHEGSSRRYIDDMESALYTFFSSFPSAVEVGGGKPAWMRAGNAKKMVEAASAAGCAVVAPFPSSACAEHSDEVKAGIGRQGEGGVESEEKELVKGGSSGGGGRSGGEGMGENAERGRSREEEELLIAEVMAVEHYMQLEGKRQFWAGSGDVVRQLEDWGCAMSRPSLLFLSSLLSSLLSYLPGASVTEQVECVWKGVTKEGKARAGMVASNEEGEGAEVNESDKWKCWLSPFPFSALTTAAEVKQLVRARKEGSEACRRGEEEGRRQRIQDKGESGGSEVRGGEDDTYCIEAKDGLQLLSFWLGTAPFPPTSPIDNSGIARLDEASEWQLKPDMVEDVHYLRIPAHIWEVVKAKNGAQPTVPYPSRLPDANQAGVVVECRVVEEEGEGRQGGVLAEPVVAMPVMGESGNGDRQPSVHTAMPLPPHMLATPLLPMSHSSALPISPLPVPPSHPSALAQPQSSHAAQLPSPPPRLPVYTDQPHPAPPLLPTYTADVTPALRPLSHPAPPLHPHPHAHPHSLPLTAQLLPHPSHQPQPLLQPPLLPSDPLTSVQPAASPLPLSPLLPRPAGRQ
uniref:non-specific serine/threonine protein kinase n=1 Tax=Palpitomonas bilix TaxID=652834 RepID=A0A7S3D2B0_9EUKA|mmetsp:Transcript_18794/g.47647  ORF Transcript_18794/g.47647 Transcript_18794/m.47647 type:complete len:909 (+) Transcript_18794:163-2889(+)